MRFTFLALSACLASAMRPELSKIQAGVGSQIARISDILSNVTKTKDLAALKETTDAVGGILAEIPEYRGALEHMTEGQQDVLHFAILTFEDLIFQSLYDCHDDNVDQLDDAIGVIGNCNVLVAFEQSPQGDVGKLETNTSLFQLELNRLQGVVDDKTEINNTAWEKFNSHMQLIAAPPSCPGLPARTMPALDIYFEESSYVIWFTAQQSAYFVVARAWSLADEALKNAIDAYDEQLVKRDAEYCDWKFVLEALCHRFDSCYADANADYTTLAQHVTVQMDDRISIKKSGDIIIHMLRFLLGEVEDTEPPAEDTADFQIAFPAIPDKGLCDLTVLDADRWVPTPVCFDVPHYPSRPAIRGVGNCGTYGDTLPAPAIGSSPHTIVMALDFFPAARTAPRRQWLFNLGQTGTGANHWIYNPVNQIPAHGVLQFGAWNGPQIKKGAINPSQILTSVYDGHTYSLYVDGDFSSEIQVSLNIKNGDMCVGDCGRDLPFQGCVRGVDVYRVALTAEQVPLAASKLKRDVRVGA